MDYDSWDELMTAEQFCEYARVRYSYLAEHYFESKTQYQSECALYGDAGIGQGAHLNYLAHKMDSIASRYHQLTGNELEHDAYPIGWEDISDRMGK